jgi:hypothetical protein
MEKIIKQKNPKRKSDKKKLDFYKDYSNNHNHNPVTISQYNNFTSDLFKRFSKAIVELNLELKLGRLGKFRIQSINVGVAKKSGDLRKRQPDWARTKEYWKTKYPGLTPEELKEIKNKLIIYHENEHSNGEYYKHLWDRLTMRSPNYMLYKFIPSRQFSRLLAKTVKDPNRKVFYYG